MTASLRSPRSPVLGVLTMLAIAGAQTPCAGQATDEPGFVIGGGGKGVGIGDVPRLDGLRLNFRDRELELARGVNVTIWEPHDDLAGGRVQGLAVGLPLAGARTLQGLGTGLGIGVLEDFHGIGIAGLGMGAGRDLVGIHAAGLGMGAGRDVRGLVAGGLGLGVGRDAAGIIVGGLGAGVGGSVRGILIGGLGAGIGGDLEGIGIAGAGFGVGGTLKGLAITGIGVGGRSIRGVVLSGVGVGSVDVRGAVLAPLYFQVGTDDDRGSFEGVAIGAVTRIRGTQRGITIGLVNIAEELHGVQVGLVNIARNKNSLSVLPIINWSR